MEMTNVAEGVEVDEDVDFGVDDLVDMPERVAQMRQQRRATWVRFVGERALHLNTHELVSAGFREEGSIPGHLFYQESQQPVMGWTVQSLSGAEHRMARALQSPFFRQKLLPGYVTSLFEPTARELIDGFADRGEADLVAEFTKQYPMRVIMRLLDLEASDEVNWAQLAWDMIRAAFDLDTAVRAIDEFDRHVGPIIEERRRHPGDDLISALVTAEVDGERMSDADVFSFVRLMFPAGSDTTLLGLGNVLLALLTDPEAMAQVLADPMGEATWAIEEGLRLQPSVAHLPRRTGPEDVEWRGLSIPANSMVLLGVLAANRDPAEFPDPDRFDVGRRPKNIMTWGFAAHHCLGMHFALAEMEYALRALLERLPGLRLAEGVPVPVVHGSLLRGPEHLDVTFG
jgi:cytochrome P450